MCYIISVKNIAFLDLYTLHCLINVILVNCTLKLGKEAVMHLSSYVPPTPYWAVVGD